MAKPVIIGSNTLTERRSAHKLHIWCKKLHIYNQAINLHVVPTAKDQLQVQKQEEIQNLYVVIELSRPVYT